MSIEKKDLIPMIFNPKSGRNVIDVSQLSKQKIAALNLVKQMVAKGTSDEEFALFMYLSDKYGLDPLNKEIWCVKHHGGGSPYIMTSRDGYVKIANSHSDFKGLHSGVVREGDIFEIDMVGEELPTHKITGKRGKIIGAWALVLRKDRAPSKSFVDFDEMFEACGRNPIWKKYPSDMVRKVAEVRALKPAFQISGLLTQEEIVIGENEQIMPTPKVEDSRGREMDAIRIKKMDKAPEDFVEAAHEPDERADVKKSGHNQSSETVVVSEERTQPETKDEEVLEKQTASPTEVSEEVDPPKLTKKEYAKYQKIFLEKRSKLKWTPQMLRAFLSNAMECPYEEMKLENLTVEQAEKGVIALEEQIKDEFENLPAQESKERGRPPKAQSGLENDEDSHL